MKGVSRRSELMLCFDWSFCSKTFAKQTNQQQKENEGRSFLDGNSLVSGLQEFRQRVAYFVQIPICCETFQILTLIARQRVRLCSVGLFQEVVGEGEG